MQVLYMDGGGGMVHGGKSSLWVGVDGFLLLYSAWSSSLPIKRQVEWNEIQNGCRGMKEDFMD